MIARVFDTVVDGLRFLSSLAAMVEGDGARGGDLAEREVGQGTQSGPQRGLKERRGTVFFSRTGLRFGSLGEGLLPARSLACRQNRLI